ncbi:MAG: metallophosphoesterase [Fibromonadaceae bacterium]|jgi:predicted MPP superfamily phosphohydrolase|nr:metallophosphoesterase [Fibromonadaceae bacterium]
MIAFLPILLLLLFYAWWRFRFVFPRKYRYYGALLFTLLFVSGFLYRVISNDFIFMALAAIGAFTIVFLANWIVFCLFWDLYLGIRRLLGKSKLSNKNLRMRREPLFASAVAALTTVFFLIGVPSQYHFKVTTVKANLATAPKKTLRIALFSDIHFDALFQKSKLELMLDSLRVLRPDAIFFAGDLADISMDKLQEKGYDSLFSQIKAPLGFYLATGNHESFMNPKGRIIEWLQGFDNATLLLDSTVCNNFFCVTGRLDHQYAKRHSGDRASLEELTPVTDSIPWFVIDHQPKGLTLHEMNLTRKPDFTFSGHTHAGQFFPVTVIIKILWPLSYGLGEINSVPWYVTSGIGQWGPPVRIGSKSELVLFEFF